MKISGKYVMDAPVEKVWKMINDPGVLEKITPGVKRLISKGDDQYEAVSEVKIGPVRGRFEGALHLKDKEEHQRMVVALDQKSRMGNALAEIGIQLRPSENGQTEIHYTGDVKMSGMLGRMGQRIIGGVVSTLSKQFFAALTELIQKEEEE